MPLGPRCAMPSHFESLRASELVTPLARPLRRTQSFAVREASIDDCAAVIGELLSEFLGEGALALLPRTEGRGCDEMGAKSDESQHSSHGVTAGSTRAWTNPKYSRFSLESAFLVTDSGPRAANSPHPDPALRPVLDPVVHTRPWAEALGQRSPGNSGADSIQDGIDEAPIAEVGDRPRPTFSTLTRDRP